MSNQNSAAIVTHFIVCDCEMYDVSALQKKLKMKQSNISKHLTSLNKRGVLICKKNQREKYYKIDPNFKEKWFKTLKMIINSEDMKGFQCENKFKTINKVN